MSKIYINKVVEIAKREVGYHEKKTNYDLDDKLSNAGSGNWTKYARDLWEASPRYYQSPKNGYDWCTIFVDWCIYQASGLESTHAQEIKYYTGPYGAGCKFAANYYKQAGAWYAIPKVGDQIFFGEGDSYKHTGIVVAVAENYVYTVEGNADNQVKERTYTLTNKSILGYGRPKYDGDIEPNMPFVDVKEGAWYYDALLSLYSRGIVSGTDATHASPNKSATRAEVWQMIYNLLK